MKKTELMKEFQELEEEKQVHIDGIAWNSKKSEIQNAIECLKCPDELLEKYLIVLSLKYEKIGRLIAGNGDFKHHSHNRLYRIDRGRLHGICRADQKKNHRGSQRSGKYACDLSFNCRVYCLCAAVH